MARPRKFVETDVVEAAAAAFGSLGYAGTTLEDLSKATGLGKQSIYNTFGDKHDLFLRVLSSRSAAAIEAIDSSLNAPGSTPLERIRAQMLKLAVALSSREPHDLLVTKATLELADTDAGVADIAMDVFKQQQRIYRQCIVAAQSAGEIDTSVDATALAAYFVAVSRGMEVIGLAGASRAKLTSIALTSLSGIT
jgi:TetR/AcrR family transcriptional regulator, transcriptional repressor for nem operon